MQNPGDTKKAPIRVSNSSTNALSDCQQYYKFQYVDRIRPETTGSALIFGSAIDNALNTMLEEKLLSPILTNKTPEQVFLESMSTIEINDVKHEGKGLTLITYSKGDFDLDLLTEDDIAELSKEISSEIGDFVQSCHYYKGELEENEIRLFSKIGWMCLYRKGLMLLSAYREDILPTIDYVVSVQEKVELVNDSGDILVGVIDAIIKFKDDDIIYICDNKTSSTPYKESDLYNSKQLATYSEYKQNPYVAYLVLEKKIRKNEPRVRTQILKGKLTNELMEKIFLDYQRDLDIIKKGIFEKNHKKCYNFFGKKCPFFGICKEGSMDGLVKLGERK